MIKNKSKSPEREANNLILFTFANITISFNAYFIN